MVDQQLSLKALKSFQEIQEQNARDNAATKKEALRITKLANRTRTTAKKEGEKVHSELAVDSQYELTRVRSAGQRSHKDTEHPTAKGARSYEREALKLQRRMLRQSIDIQRGAIRDTNALIERLKGEKESATLMAKAYKNQAQSTQKRIDVLSNMESVDGGVLNWKKEIEFHQTLYELERANGRAGMERAKLSLDEFHPDLRFSALPPDLMGAVQWLHEALRKLVEKEERGVERTYIWSLQRHLGAPGWGQLREGKSVSLNLDLPEGGLIEECAAVVSDPAARGIALKLLTNRPMTPETYLGYIHSDLSTPAWESGTLKGLRTDQVAKATISMQLQHADALTNDMTIYFLLRLVDYTSWGDND